MRWDRDSHEGLPYRYALPPQYDPRRRYPLVVYLHGSAERGTDGQAHLKNGVDALVGRQLIAVAPHCPTHDTFGGLWYGGESETQRKVISLVRELGRRRSVDAQRVSLIGFSMGAIGAWFTIERHPELFSAAVPIAGDVDPQAARKLTQFPIWAFHGAADRLVSPDNTRRVAKYMAERGANFRYTEFPGVGHDSWKPAFETPELLPWLLNQK